MLIVNNKETITYHPIIKYLPSKIRNLLTFSKLSDAEEIRLRKGLPLVINFSEKSCFLTDVGCLTNSIKNAVIVTDSDIKEALELIVKSSLYTAENSLKQGFVTVEGGNRIGISGSAVITDNKISSLKNISGLNYRIAKEICGVADNIIDNIYRNGKILNTLIISPPCCGKTTILRDMIRNLSNGFESFRGKNISLVDERSEIAAMYKGVPQNDVGIRTDVMSNLKKSTGIRMMIRSMGPQIIATDEIGGENDFNSVVDAVYSGVKLLLTVHGNDIDDVSKSFIDNHLFKIIDVLTKKNKPRWSEKYLYIGG